jgi:metal-responsive CopG/Arc/MetJ family transcriptional regulator
MPSETIYLDSKQWATVDELTERDGINNRSQAIQYLVNNCAQDKIVEEQ